ncbi:MAG TPA: hypothetical protein EYG42_11795 [Porticoccaceae bacterium]|nr:hypothetical protein [Porticoccaceae bacterium]
MAGTNKFNTLFAILAACLLVACEPQPDDSIAGIDLMLDEISISELQEMMQAADLSAGFRIILFCPNSL